MTSEELNTIEYAEYRDLVDRLVKFPDFVAFVARWVVDSGFPPRTSISANSLDVANFQIGRVSLLSEFMDSMKLVHHAAYLQIQEEVDRYEQRRIESDRGDPEGGDDSFVYEGDFD